MRRTRIVAEFQYIGTSEDNAALGEFLFTQFHAQLFIDESESSVLKSLDSCRDLEHFLDNNPMPPLLFAIAQAWGDYPLIASEVKSNDGRHFFSIRQRYGGPAFTWNLSRQVQRQDQQSHTFGMFGDYPWYYVRPDCRDTFDRPTAMSEAYKSILKYVKNNGRRARWRRSNNPGPWVLSGAFKLSLEGTWLGPDNDVYVPSAA